FTLRAKTLLIEGFGLAIFRLPPFADPPANTQLGTEWFHQSAAFKIKITTSSLEMFADGVLTISPAGHKVFDLREQAALVIKPTGFAGKFRLGASINLPGISLSGTLEAYINTFKSDQVIEISPFLQPAVGYSSVTIFGRPPKLNPAYIPGDATSPLLVDDPAATAGVYFTIAAYGNAQLLNTLTLTGLFKLTISAHEVSVVAAVATAINVPGTNTPLFSLTGSAAFTVDG